MKNISIALCDDEPYVLQEFARMIERLAKNHYDNCSVHQYQDPLLLLEDIPKMDIVFLDIDMPEMDGIQTGKRIRVRNPDCLLIMATGRIDRFKDAFKIDARRFISKPFDEEEVDEALGVAIKLLTLRHKITLHKSNVQYEINQDSIIYIEAFDGYVRIYTATEKFRSESSLDEMEKQLDEHLFCRIHRSYIINIGFVTSYSKTELRVGDTELRISRRKYTDFIKKYREFDLHFRF